MWRVLCEAVLILLLTAAATWSFCHLYLPAQARCEETLAREAALRAAVQALRDDVARRELRRDALEATNPQAVEEAIRDELGWGRPGERLLYDLASPSPVRPQAPLHAQAPLDAR